jgi:hypothetical protein
MLDRIRAKLSFANVVSLIALFVALGGGAYAAATINGGDVVNNSLTGQDIKENTLKGVLRCPPSSPNRVAGICYSKSFGATLWNTALENCQSRKSRLPTIGEAFLIYRRAGNGQTWTDEVTDLADPNSRGSVKKDPAVPGGIEPFATPDTSLLPYRCITTPTA